MLPDHRDEDLAHLDHVDVDLQYPFLRQMVFERPGDEVLLHFAKRIARRREVEVLRQLLRDRRAAMRQLFVRPVFLDGFLQPFHVHRVVFEAEGRAVRADDLLPLHRRRRPASRGPGRRRCC